MPISLMKFSIIDDAERLGVISENLRHYKAIALSMNKQYDEAIDLFSSFEKESLTHNDYVFMLLLFKLSKTE